MVHFSTRLGTPASAKSGEFELGGGWGPRRPLKGNQLALSQTHFGTRKLQIREQQSRELRGFPAPNSHETRYSRQAITTLGPITPHLCGSIVCA